MHGGIWVHYQQTLGGSICTESINTPMFTLPHSIQCRLDTVYRKPLSWFYLSRCVHCIWFIAILESKEPIVESIWQTTHDTDKWTCQTQANGVSLSEMDCNYTRAWAWREENIINSVRMELEKSAPGSPLSHGCLAEYMNPAQCCPMLTTHNTLLLPAELETTFLSLPWRHWRFLAC